MRTTHTPGGRGGSATIEFTLVGIPLLFILISIFEMARGMWTYHTLAYAMKEGVRYAVVHGQNRMVSPNVCLTALGQGCRLQDIAWQIQNAGVGLAPTDLTDLRFIWVDDGYRELTCATLQACLSDARVWPGDPANVSPAGQPPLKIQIAGRYPFRTAVSIFWPGAGGFVFGRFTLGATSRETIQF